ncbi:MAG: HD domain-containing protein [Candidatus Omnitrophota bacterium]
MKAEYKDILKPVYAFANKAGVKLYLVGGILRDAVLKREKHNLDFDFCLKDNAINFGSRLAKEIRCGFVVLDKEHGACRLVEKIKDKIYTLDFSDFRGRTLEEDLKHRDFTINTLALELKDLFLTKNPQAKIIDSCAALGDLKAKVIKMASPQAFDEDALRILRAFSLAATFGFKIEPRTLQLIKSKAKKLSDVSLERIRDELFKILDSRDSFEYISEMDNLGVIKAAFPEFNIMRGVKQGPYHHLDVWKHTLEALKQLDGLIVQVHSNKEIQSYLAEVICAERSRRSLVKLGALLHDIGKPAALRRKNGKTMFHGHERIGSEIAQDVARRLKLSNDELQALNKMVFWHLRPGYLADTETPSARARFRYFRDTAEEGLSILLLSMADQRATRGPLTSRDSRQQHERVIYRLIKEYFKNKKEKKLVGFLNGDELIKKFKLEPSPLIGKVLLELEELQVIGRLKNKKEALEAAKKIIDNER